MHDHIWALRKSYYLFPLTHMPADAYATRTEGRKEQGMADVAAEYRYNRLTWEEMNEAIAMQMARLADCRTAGSTYTASAGADSVVMQTAGRMARGGNARPHAHRVHADMIRSG